MLSDALVDPDALTARFERLDALLHHWRDYWQLRPFHWLDHPWRDRHPALVAWLESLDEAALDRLDADPPALAQALQPFVPEAGTLIALCEIPAAAPPPTLPQRLGRHVPGRKWAQVRAFAAALGDCDLPVLEWCAGKGHLGRLLAGYYGRPVLSLERDPLLCEAGQALAGDDGRQHFAAVDVLGDGVPLAAAQQVVALHACGELHQHLLRVAAATGIRSLAVAPCCYHRIPHDVYRPLSLQAVRHSPLRLARADLQLPLQEQVTGGVRIRRLREREVVWRLGFDLLQRELTGKDRYRPVPNVRGALLNRDFAAFCRWAAAVKGLDMPADCDFAHYEARGRDRRRLVRRIGLVRHLFRRPLELWLLLDRALFLQERGYRVGLQRFCDRRLTPRDLLLQASRR
ncbi:MAG: methyltransferase [Candidatus Competibacterales bacterium]|nr:methyltransferase [Candidatus Competibacterales bacterium]